MTEGASAVAKKRKFWWITLWVSLAALVVTPLATAGFHLHGMQHSLDALGKSGQGDTAELSKGIGEVLVSLAICTAIAFTALVLLIVSAVRLRSLKQQEHEAALATLIQPPAPGAPQA